MTAEPTLSPERLLSIVKSFRHQRIVVVGDCLADQFVYGVIDRVSREAPVFIIRHEQTETIPGGAGNCAANVGALGAEVTLVSILGGDEAGKIVSRKLEDAGVHFQGIHGSPETKTTTKTRILAGQSHSTRQQVIRIDYEATKSHLPGSRALLLEQIFKNIKTADAVIISDYGYGTVDAEVTDLIRNASKELEIPVIIDSRFQLSNFAGFASATPNEDEVEHLLGKQFTELSELETASEQLRSRLGYRALLVTRGSHGMVLLEEGVAPVHLDAVGAHEPVDVTGAGDTVMATYALALASGSSFSDAARLANYAGGVVVMKRGTATVTPDELEHSILQSNQ